MVGTAVRVTGNNFYSEGITYENTFNQKVVAAELADGVENDASSSSPGANTTYDRTQTDADVKLTTATERAAALVIDGSQAELYNCKFIGSQDTVYTGSGNNYFNNCLLAGETDYIFGNGGTTIFDDCELQWIDYHYASSTDPVKEKAGYIAVPRGSYIFRNCEITSSGEGKNITTGTAVTTEGYYGRPWGEDASVLFMNCKTNSLILDAGWAAMSGVEPAAVAFREYNNTTDGTTSFYSTLATDSTTATMSDGTNRILSTDEAAELAAEYDWNIFDAWLPSSHVDYVGNPNIYKFDFTSGSVTSPVSDESGVAELTQSGYTYHGTQYGAQAKSGSTMTVYADSNAEEMSISVNSSFNGNAGTLELYKNNEVATCGAIEFDNSADNELKTFTVTNVAEGDTYTVKYVGTNIFYCGYVQVSTDGTLTTATVTNTYTYDFTTLTGSKGDALSGDFYDTENKAPINFENGIKYHSTSYGIFVGDGAYITFDVTTAGSTTITIPSSYTSNSGYVTLYDSDGNSIASTDTLSGVVDGTITADLEVGTYTLMYSATGSFYTKGLTIVTTGELGTAEVVSTTTYSYDFTSATDTIEGTSAKAVATDNTLAKITLDATSGKFRAASSGNGYQVNTGSVIGFTIAGAESTVTLSLTTSYIGTDTTTTVNIRKAGSTDVIDTITISSKGTVTKDVELAAGDYELVFADSTNEYISAMSIALTEGTTIGARPDVRGNVNDDDNVDILDVISILGYSDSSSYSDEQKLNADYNLDGEITTTDAVVVLKAVIAA